MKVGILSESPADEAAVHILLEELLGETIDVVKPPLRARGWPNVAQVLPAILHHLQFRTDASALVVVVDSDDTQLHEGDHADPDRFHPQCRMCQLELVIRRTIKKWRLPKERLPLRTAVGMAVPAVEGWYLCGRDSEVGEATWRKCQEGGVCPFNRRELKWRTYGTVRPTLALETRRASEEARRLREDIHKLEIDFPIGFGSLARTVRKWKKEKSLTCQQ